MKRTLVRISIFIGGFLLLTVLLQGIIFFITRRIKIGDFGVLNAIENGIINTEMLVCGSSIGQSHYDPEILSEVTGISCYNIGLSGSALGVQLPALKWYLDKNRSPRFIIQNIDIFIGEIDSYIYEPYKYLPYLNNENLYKGLLRINHQLWLHKYVPIANLIYFNKDFQRSIFLGYFASLKGKKDILTRGYFPNDRPWIGEKLEKEFQKRNAGGIRYNVSKANQGYLRELADVCQKRKIQLIFVISPEKENIVALETNRKEITEFYSQFCNEKRIWFLDLSHSDLSQESELWVNMTHMKAKGAERFSRELGAKIKAKISSEEKAMKK